MAVVKIWKRVKPTWGNTGVEPEDQWSIEIRVRPTLGDMQCVEAALKAEMDEMPDLMRVVIGRLTRNPKGLTLVDEGEKHIACTDCKVLAEYMDTNLYNELLMLITTERARALGEASPQSSGGGTTTPPDATAGSAASEQE